MRQTLDFRKILIYIFSVTECMDLEIDEEVRAHFPDLRLVCLQIRGMQVGTNSDKITKLFENVASEILNSLNIDTVKDKEDFRAYRDFFWKIGVDPTKTRPAAEALVRRILKRLSIPRINDFVDAYNIASVESSVPIAAFDLEPLEDRLILRFSREGELFIGIGMNDPKVLDQGRIVISSGEGIVAIYPYRDAEGSKITPETEDAIIIACGVPGIEIEKLGYAAVKCREYITAICGGTTSKITDI